MRGVIDDESGESVEPMEEVPLIELGESELDRAWLTERSRELIPEMGSKISKFLRVSGSTHSLVLFRILL